MRTLVIALLAVIGAQVAHANECDDVGCVYEALVMGMTKCNTPEKCIPASSSNPGGSSRCEC
jgi:hypothetical protein